jgi:hypothetical protein
LLLYARPLPHLAINHSDRLRLNKSDLEGCEPLYDTCHGGTTKPEASRLGIPKGPTAPPPFHVAAKTAPQRRINAWIVQCAVMDVVPLMSSIWCGR